MYATYKPVEVPDVGLPVGTGWLPPLPDLRDFTDAGPEIAEMAKKLGLPKSGELKAPSATVDLRTWCSPIENQKSLGSCTAHAAVGVVEYLQRRAFSKELPLKKTTIFLILCYPFDKII